MSRALLVTLLLVLGLAGEAAAQVAITVDASTTRGQLDLYGQAGPEIRSVTIYEVLADRDKKLGEFEPEPWYVHPERGQIGLALMKKGAQWRCDRLDRTFAIVGEYPDGLLTERSTFSVRTPSCRHRLSLKAPRRVKPRGRLIATLRDTFGTGDTAARVCLAGRCKRYRLKPGQRVKRLGLTAPRRTGIRPLTLAGPGQRLTHSVAVGVRPTQAVGSGPTVLTTGDSMMQSVDAMLSDRLAKRANVVSDVKVASSLSSTSIVDYTKLSRQQVRKHRPAVVAIFLGTNEFYDMVTPDGATVKCCDQAWEAEYERRARNLLATYAQNGTASVAWIAVPAMRDRRRDGSGNAVNAAIGRAAAAVPGAFVVPANEILTPGGNYQQTVDRNGRQVTIREDDGIHLTIAGARLVVAELFKSLKSAGVF